MYNDLTEAISRTKVLKWRLPSSGEEKFPAIKLHYLAIDDRYRGKDYGKFLLGEVFSIAKYVQEVSGCNFITVEALNQSTEFYKEHGFEYLNYNMDRKKEFKNMLFKIDDLQGL